jgi:hypothetical protein
VINCTSSGDPADYGYIIPGDKRSIYFAMSRLMFPDNYRLIIYAEDKELLIMLFKENLFKSKVKIRITRFRNYAKHKRFIQYVN